MLTRRRFLGLSSAMLAGRAFLRPAFGQTFSFTDAPGSPLRLAVLGSTYQLGSNLQSIVDRFLVGYPWEGNWHMPNAQVVSIYVDALVPKFGGPMKFAQEMRAERAAALGRLQGTEATPHSQPEAPPHSAMGPPQPPVAQSITHLGRRRGGLESPENDLTFSRARQFGFRVCHNIPETLRCGGERLAVDAVLVVVEQGNYPTNDLGQILLPCYDFFQRCVQVFGEERRAVPYFNHNQLSFGFTEAKQMVATAGQLGMPLLAGSSLPVTWRLPPVDVPTGARVEEAVMVGVGGLDVGDFAALEAMQSMLERRSGGETGVKAVQLLEGDDVWAAGHAGRWSRDLLSSALSRSDTPLGLTLLDGRTQDLVASGVLPQLVKDPTAYCIEYADGVRATLLMLNGAVMDFNIAVRMGDNQFVSTQFFRPPTPNVTNTACLAAKIEQMYTTGSAPYTAQRTLLTSGVLEACLESRRRLNQRLETPHLAVRYHPPAESQYART